MGPRDALKRLGTAFDPQARLIEKVAESKRLRQQSGARYDEQPRLSLILLSFNHRDNAAPIAEGLARTSATELIVCDDGSVDGAEQAWQRHLTRPNDFLIRSNDIHDSRIYNRAAELSRGDLICILQDDDIPPATGAWVDEALGLFERDPKLAVLGGHQGWSLDFTKPPDRVHHRAVYGYREAKRFHYAKDIPFRDPVSGQPFMYVQGVSIGPIFFRRQVYRELGGFNLEYSAAGEVGMLVDHELSMRAWLAGHRVAVYGPAPFQRYVGGQGTVMFGAESRSRNLLRSFQWLHRDFAGRAADIDRQADELNRSLTAAL